MENFTTKERLELFISFIKGTDRELGGSILWEIVREANSWDGSFEDLEFYEMDDLDELLQGKTPSELLRMIDASFDLNQDYFYFDSYGEVCSIDEMNIFDDLFDQCEEICEWLLENLHNANYLNIPVGLLYILEDLTDFYSWQDVLYTNPTNNEVYLRSIEGIKYNEDTDEPIYILFGDIEALPDELEEV